LRRFPVARTGRVLLFAAEDALGVVRCRLDGICAAAGVDLAALDLDVITAPTLRIDTQTTRRASPRRSLRFVQRCSSSTPL
jgi:hypothetical protein